MIEAKETTISRQIGAHELGLSRERHVASAAEDDFSSERVVSTISNSWNSREVSDSGSESSQSSDSQRRNAKAHLQQATQRITMEHSYHDNSQAEDDSDESRVGGVVSPFPVVLHRLLEASQVSGFGDIVSWLPHGRAFLVHDQERFVNEVMPQYFRKQTR